MSEERLYALLSEGSNSEPPWAPRAEQFLRLKIASGGLLAEEEDALKLAATQVDLKTEAQDAARKGALSGLMSATRERVMHPSRLRRTRGERYGRELGTLGGAAAGYQLGKDHGLAGKAVGTALGAAIGRGVGKTVGQDIDVARSKKATMEKDSCYAKTAALQTMLEAINDYHTKVAQGEEVPVIPVEKATPASRDPLDSVGALEEFLQAQQQMNESEFFRQRSEEAQQAAATQAERADMAEQQLQQMAEQQQAQQEEQAANDQMVQQQGQAAQQENLALKDESLQAQQSNMELRQAITAFRQQIMDLLAQDPTQAVMAPTAQEPSQEEVAAAGQQSAQGPTQAGAPPPSAAPPKVMAPPQGALTMPQAPAMQAQ